MAIGELQTDSAPAVEALLGLAVGELTSRYRTLMVNDPHYRLQLGLMTALLYLLMSYPLSLLARRLEGKRR